MAVYTTLSAAELAALVAEYDVGELVSAKGIAEGVSNSNWLIETTRARYILTMYEARVAVDDLPFFLGLLDHLSAKGSPVPRTIHDRTGAAYRLVHGKAVALIEFLPGVSVDTPNPAQARAVGAALAGLHLDAADFPAQRRNTMDLATGQPVGRDDGLARHGNGGRQVECQAHVEVGRGQGYAVPVRLDQNAGEDRNCRPAGHDADKARHCRGERLALDTDFHWLFSRNPMAQGAG